MQNKIVQQPKNANNNTMDHRYRSLMKFLIVGKRFGLFLPFSVFSHTICHAHNYFGLEDGFTVNDYLARGAITKQMKTCAQ